MENLENIIEAVLFATGRYISISELSTTLGKDSASVENALKNLSEKFGENSALSLVFLRNGVQLVTNKKYYEYVSKFVENTKKDTLSPSLLETLTIIAYNPKITKADVEKIRGVNSDFAVARLLEAGLIEEVARLNLPGRPAVYAVSDEFLKSAGIKEVNELPDFETLKINDEQVIIDELNKEN